MVLGGDFAFPQPPVAGVLDADSLRPVVLRLQVADHHRVRRGLRRLRVAGEGLLLPLVLGAAQAVPVQQGARGNLLVFRAVGASGSERERR